MIECHCGKCDRLAIKNSLLTTKQNKRLFILDKRLTYKFK